MSLNKRPQDWDVYWQGRSEEGSPHRECIDQSGVLKNLWQEFFASTLKDRSSPVVLDLACGAGAVFENISDREKKTTLIGADYSHAAISAALVSNKMDQGVVCSLDALPFADRAIDVLTSQYGVEYAGVSAIEELPRHVRSGGMICLICHSRDSEIFRECSENADAATDLMKLDIINAAVFAFEATDARGTDAQRQLANKRLTDAVRSLEQVIAKYDKAVAGGMLSQLYAGLQQMFSRRTAFDTGDAIAWCQRFNAETQSYIERMTAMTRSALSEADINTILTEYNKAGAKPDDSRTGPVRDGSAVIGYRLIFDKDD